MADLGNQIAHATSLLSFRDSFRPPGPLGWRGVLLRVRGPLFPSPGLLPSDQGEPHINGTPIVDGQTYLIRGTEWLVRSDDIGDSTKRFLCTPAPEPQGGR